MRVNAITLNVGSAIFTDQAAACDQPWAPAPSTALLAAVQRTECSPMPLTGTCAPAPAYQRAGAPSTEHEIPSIPDGLPPAVAVTYCTPAVDGADVGPDIDSVGWLLST